VSAIKEYCLIGIRRVLTASTPLVTSTTVVDIKEMSAMISSGVLSAQVVRLETPSGMVTALASDKLIKPGMSVSGSRKLIF